MATLQLHFLQLNLSLQDFRSRALFRTHTGFSETDAFCDNCLKSNGQFFPVLRGKIFIKSLTDVGE